jgi:hypothetical protein
MSLTVTISFDTGSPIEHEITEGDLATRVYTVTSDREGKLIKIEWKRDSTVLLEQNPIDHDVEIGHVFHVGLPADLEMMGVE